jgi:DNA replication ATP-dependent helicase Dna2
VDESAYLAALSEFIEDEYATNSAAIRGMWAQSLNVRIDEGEAIGDVEIVKTQERFFLARCMDNMSKFREGDSLRLHRCGPVEEGFVSCSLAEDRGNELLLHSEYGLGYLKVAPGTGWLLDRDIADTRKQIKLAIEELAQEPEVRGYLLGILQGRNLPVIDSKVRDLARSEAAGKGLRGSQQDAYACALTTKNYYLVQGPPGTGKTWVLAYLAEELAKRGETVLITSFTHRGINNALRKIVKTTGYKRVIKVGQRQHARDLKWEGGQIMNYEKFADYPGKNDRKGLIVGGTAFALRSKRLSCVQFGTIIFDEAGQLTLPLALVAMLSGRRYIFIGDHQQMAPVIAGEHANTWVKRSIFETLFVHAPGTMLDVTYRMNAEVNEFPSARFYGGKLRSSEDAANKRLNLKPGSTRFSEILDPKHPVVFAELAHVGKTVRSAHEAELAAQLAVESVWGGIPPREIAIIAPFRAQGRLIRKRLKDIAEECSLEDVDQIVVDTVERIQGQERDVIIISLTTSDPYYAALQADFYFQPNRLNVAITRPRVKCIVIGSPRLFEAKPELEEHKAWVEHFQALRNHSYIVRVPLEQVA